MSQKNLFLTSAAVLTIAAALSACGNSTKPAPANASSRVLSVSAKAKAPTDVQTAAVQPAAALTGAISFTSYSHEDGSAMSNDDLTAAITAFPTLAANYQELLNATQADIDANGSLTLRDSNGNILATIPSSGFQTIRSFNESVGTASEQSCTGTSLVFDLNDQCQAPQAKQPSQSQDQQSQQSQGKVPAVAAPAAVQSAGFLVTMTMPCQVLTKPAQEQSKPTPAQAQGKPAPAPETKPVPAQQAPQAKPTSTPSS